MAWMISWCSCFFGSFVTPAISRSLLWQAMRRSYQMIWISSEYCRARHRSFPIKTKCFKIFKNLSNMTRHMSQNCFSSLEGFFFGGNVRRLWTPKENALFVSQLKAGHFLSNRTLGPQVDTPKPRNFGLQHMPSFKNDVENHHNEATYHMVLHDLAGGSDRSLFVLASFASELYRAGKSPSLVTSLDKLGTEPKWGCQSNHFMSDRVQASCCVRRSRWFHRQSVIDTTMSNYDSLNALKILKTTKPIPSSWQDMGDWTHTVKQTATQQAPWSYSQAKTADLFTMSIHRVLRSIDPETETEHFEARLWFRIHLLHCRLQKVLQWATLGKLVKPACRNHPKST